MLLADCLSRNMCYQNHEEQNQQIIYSIKDESVLADLPV